MQKVEWPMLLDSPVASISGTTASVHEITVQHQDGQGQGLAKHTWESHSVWLTVPFPGAARRSSQSVLKEISPGCSLEGLMLKLKLQYLGHLVRRLKAGGEGDDRE